MVHGFTKIAAVEKAESNWAAYVPDLPGCITPGSIELHLEAMLEVWERLRTSGNQFRFPPAQVSTSDVDFVELETVA